MTLFVNSCVRHDSRTLDLANYLLPRFDGITEIKLEETPLPVLDEKRIDKRTALCKSGDFSDGMFDLAKQFASADTVVIAAPFWDLSFPSLLKRYIEQICVTGITFKYSEDGFPIGLCKAKKLYYVTTCGGPLFCPEFGFGYIETIATKMFGISECKLIAAENLDIVGSDTDKILAECKKRIDNL